MPEDKKPQDEFDPNDADHLLDDDEIDIEALLEDDDDDDLLSPDADDDSGGSETPVASSTSRDRREEREESAEMTAEDLLDDDDLLDLGDPEEDAGRSADDVPAASASESNDAAEALLDGLDDELDLSDDVEEPAPVAAESTAKIDDLDDDPTAFLDDDDDFLAEESGEAAEEATAKLGSSDDDPTAFLGDEDESAEEPAGRSDKPAKEKKKALGKPRKSARKQPARLTPKGKKTDKKSAKKSVAKERKPKKPAPVRQGAEGGSIAFICSECYEEFLLPTNYAHEAVTCPECLHVGKRPDENFLNTVLEHKKGEKASFVTVLCVAALLLVSALFWIWSASPYSTMQLDDTVKYGVMGVTGLLGVLLIWLIVKFEGNRWEVYF